MLTRYGTVAVVGVMLGCAEPATAPSTTLGGEGEPTQISFQALLPGDTLIAVIHSYGCFHDLRAMLTLASSGGGASVSASTSSMNLAPGWVVVAPSAMSRPELVGLDRLLSHYRGGGGEWACTNHEELTLTLRRKGVEILREAYRDDSCQAYDDADIVALVSLFHLEHT